MPIKSQRRLKTQLLKLLLQHVLLYRQSRSSRNSLKALRVFLVVKKKLKKKLSLRLTIASLAAIAISAALKAIVALKTIVAMSAATNVLSATRRRTSAIHATSLLIVVTAVSLARNQRHAILVAATLSVTMISVMASVKTKNLKLNLQTLPIAIRRKHHVDPATTANVVAIALNALAQRLQLLKW